MTNRASWAAWCTACALAIAACHPGPPRPSTVPALAALAQLDATGDVFALRDRLAERPEAAGPDLAFYRVIAAHAFNRRTSVPRWW
jgi:hypothetical protein